MRAFSPVWVPSTQAARGRTGEQGYRDACSRAPPHRQPPPATPEADPPPALLGVILAVQQVEGHVLAPVVLGRAVSLHPLAVLASLAAGGALLGVLGAFIAIRWWAARPARWATCARGSRVEHPDGNALPRSRVHIGTR